MKCCPKLDPVADVVLRWTVFGLTWLSWILVVAATGVCSFAGYTDNYVGLYGYVYSEEYEIGIFCFQDSSGNKNRQKEEPGALIAAQLFATLACLLLSAALVVISLVIFVLPTIHAVRAWWTARILYCVSLFCVLLTFTFYAYCEDCTISAGSILNILNVPILIAMIVIAFWIEVPAQPLLRCCCVGGRDARDSVTATPGAKTTRTEVITPEGHKITRVKVTYPDGREEETETTEEKEHVVATAEEVANSMEAGNGGGLVPCTIMHDQSICVTKQMTLTDGNYKTVATTRHSDGRHEVVETVEEPSMIVTGGGGGGRSSSRVDMAVVEIHRTRSEHRMPTGRIKVVEEIEYSDGTKEVLESSEEPSVMMTMGGSAGRGRRAIEPPELTEL